MAVAAGRADVGLESRLSRGSFSSSSRRSWWSASISWFWRKAYFDPPFQNSCCFVQATPSRIAPGLSAAMTAAGWERNVQRRVPATRASFSRPARADARSRRFPRRGNCEVEGRALPGFAFTPMPQPWRSAIDCRSPIRCRFRDTPSWRRNRSKRFDTALREFLVEPTPLSAISSRMDVAFCGALNSDFGGSPAFRYLIAFIKMFRIKQANWDRSASNRNAGSLIETCAPHRR